MRARGEGSVYQRKDGRWAATVYDEHGRRRVLYGHTQAEVLAKRKQALRDGMPTGGPLTLDAWLQQWHAGLAHLRPSTTTDYASKIKRISRELGRHRLDRLTPERIEAAHSRWLAEGLSPGMVRNLHRVLHAALQVAWCRGLIVRNPASQVRPPAPAPKPAQALTATQARAVLARAAVMPYGVRWWLALLLGMRQGEVLSLTWDDVDLAGGLLYVRRAKSKTHRARALPLPPHVVTMLEQLPRTSDFVFPNSRGGQVDSKRDWQEWQDLLTWCHLPRVRVHDARHTTPTLLLELGVPARVVSEILGHSTTAMTLDVYTHVHDPVIRSALDALTAVLTADGVAVSTNPSDMARTRTDARLAVV